MEVEQQRIEQDLRGQIAGDVRCDDLFVQLYSSDASIYEVRPLGVVRPRSTEDVVATVRYAAENGIALHARGGGSGLAGESLGRGLIVDFSRYFRKILETGEDTVTVEAGVVLGDLNRHLHPRGKLFGPDPATSEVTTMASVVALDASGSHWPVYGSARSQVESLEVVLAGGEVATFHKHEVPSPSMQTGGGPVEEPTMDALVRGVDSIVKQYAQEIATHQPGSLVNRCGYRLDDVVTTHDSKKNCVNLARLMTGSEGTLGLITKATFKISPLPKHVGSLLLFFGSLEKAAHASLELSKLGPSACDLMDRRHLSLARESDPRYELLIPQVSEAVLLVEFQTETLDALHEVLNNTVRLIQKKKRLATGAYIASDWYDHEMLWQLARHYVPNLYRLRGLTRPLPFVEDIAVPPEALPDFLHRMQQVLKQEQVTASLFGHAGHGQLHIRPFLDLANQEDIAKIASIADRLYEEVWKVGGTISGEHGDGLSRTPFIARQYGPLALAFRDIKHLFDPQNLFNPGKVVPTGDGAITENIRRVQYPLLQSLEYSVAAATPVAGNESGTDVQVFDLQLDWQPAEMAHAARACNGCGLCRTLSPGSRMCPIFRYAPREEASPRAKANLARGVLTGSLPPGTVLEDACKEIVDLCVHCHMCRLECPANVDVPKLMMEARASYNRTNGEPLHDWFLTRIDSLCATASRYSRVANWAMGNRVARWVIEKVFGVADRRKLPRFRKRPFLQKAASRRLNVPDRSNTEKVLYFVDTYANYCDEQLAEAFVAVLEHNGISVYVPDAQLQGGMPFLARGVVEPARAIAEQNVAVLAEAVRQGYTIVATEPSAVLALSHEYLSLLPGDHDAELVSKNVFEACHYLWKLHQRGKLQLDFHPLHLLMGYHLPCHTKALEIGVPATSLLQLIPGLQIERLEKGCSGMAGMYGFPKKNYRNSLRAGLPLLTAMRTGSFSVGTTECSTCKAQMEQGNTKPTIHPVKILALSYGLMPELRELVNSPGKELLVT